tara:strand:+ start:719 stop:1012 length:294 start_codon:yes stop_codon:yes gene_type:complete
MKITKDRLKQIIKEELDYMGSGIEGFSDEDELGVTEPHRAPSDRSAAEILLQRMGVRSKLDQMSPEEVEAIAGGDQEVMGLIRRIQGDLMYAPGSGI